LQTQFARFDGSYTHYAQAGDGQTSVVILHGWAASSKQWEWLLPILAKHGCTAYALDLLGHGQAPRLYNGPHIEYYVTHLSLWMRALGIEQSVLLGHSLGGYLGLRYALDCPANVRGLILVDPLYSFHQFYRHHQLALQFLGGPEALSLGEFFFRHAPTWLIEVGHYWNQYGLADVSPSLRRQIALDYKRADPRIIQTLPTIGDLRPRLKGITAPALVAWGCNDQLFSPASFEALVDMLPAARGHPLTDAGHNPHLVRSQQFTDATLDFLRELEIEHRQPIPVSARQ
jgi:pimeloyl-ACP methyl ester carboxylesterase